MPWRCKKPPERQLADGWAGLFSTGQHTATLRVARTEERVSLLRWHRHAEQRQRLIRARVRARIRARARARAGVEVSGFGVGARVGAGQR